MECAIRRWRIEDANDVAETLNNKKILDNLRDGIPYPYTVEDAKEFITAMLNADPETTFAFAITVDDKVIGSIGVFRQNNIHSRTAEMGYYIAEPYWGRGVGTCAVKQTCEYIFRHTDIIRIYAEPFAHNIASCRILEKSGFAYEGTLRKNAVKNGVVLDMKMYSILKENLALGYSISQITEDKKQYLDLLLLADEQESMIDRYLERGEMFALYDNGVKAICVVTDEGDGVCELKNIAVEPAFQKQGYGKKLVNYLIAHYSGRYRQMIVGTGDVPGAVGFYRSCGFEYSHRIANFFTDNYDHIIIEDGVQLKDMVYLKHVLSM